MTSAPDRLVGYSPTWAPFERRKTLATWLALLAGSLGAHRLYLHGPRHWLTWLHAPLTGLGLIGALRLNHLGQDDRWAWLLLPVLGLMLSQGALHAIIYGLTSDERWHARFNIRHAPRDTRWGPVLGAIAALLVGGAVLMSTIAYTGQRFFEWQLQNQPAAQNKARLTA
jgi:hypothetical protein